MSFARLPTNEKRCEECFMQLLILLNLKHDQLYDIKDFIAGIPSRLQPKWRNGEMQQSIYGMSQRMID